MDLSFWVENDHHLSIIHLRGRLSAENIFLMREIWDTQVKLQPKTIAMDCRDLVTADVSALKTLVSFLNIAISHGINFLLLDLNSALKRILKDNGLINYFQIYSKFEFETKSGKRIRKTEAYSFTS